MVECLLSKPQYCPKIVLYQNNKYHYFHNLWVISLYQEYIVLFLKLDSIKTVWEEYHCFHFIDYEIYAQENEEMTSSKWISCDFTSYHLKPFETFHGSLYFLTGNTCFLSICYYHNDRVTATHITVWVVSESEFWPLILVSTKYDLSLRCLLWNPKLFNV